MEKIQENTLNLGLRFILELVAIFSVLIWGWITFTGLPGIIIAFGIPILLMISWATFRVSGDPKEAPVEIPGFLRLIFEFFVFGLAVYCIFDINQNEFAILLGIIVIIHYIVSHKRVVWLLRKA